MTGLADVILLELVRYFEAPGGRVNLALIAGAADRIKQLDQRR